MIYNKFYSVIRCIMLGFVALSSYYKYIILKLEINMLKPSCLSCSEFRDRTRYVFLLLLLKPILLYALTC
jgi:hypothetical protein